MANVFGKPRRVSPGYLVLICECCDGPVTGDTGFLTVAGRAWRIYHDKCARSQSVTPGVLPGVTSGKPCQIRVNQIATAELLLTALGLLASDRGQHWVGIDGTDWLQLVRRVVADTDWYFSPEGANGGQMTAKQMIEANQDAYASAGFGQQLKVKGA